MNVSKMYVPNVDKWMKYYTDVASGKENAYVGNTKRYVNQSGGGLSRNSSEFMVAIDDSHGDGEKSLPAREVNVAMVSPAQQVVEQAKSELKRTRTSSAHQSSRKRRRRNTSPRKPTGVKRRFKKRSKKRIKKRSKKQPKKRSKKRPKKQSNRRSTGKGLKKRKRTKKVSSKFMTWLQ